MSQNGLHKASAGADLETMALVSKPLVIVIDDDRCIRDVISELCEGEGYAVEAYGTSELFIETLRSVSAACLLVDAYLPGMSGIELLELLEETGRAIPSIVITGSGDVTTAVAAMRAGALDNVQKPVSSETLLIAIAKAVRRSTAGDVRRKSQMSATVKIDSLTPRQREIMDLVLAGHPSKNIAADLGLSQRTVENHRAMIMKRTGSASMPALARLAVSADLKQFDYSN
jgi:two-component system CheB/CheR fusion protein